MNILLFLPGLLVLLVQYRGLLGTLEGISLIVIVQVHPLNPSGSRPMTSSAPPTSTFLSLHHKSRAKQGLPQLRLRLLQAVPVRMDRQLAVRPREDFSVA